MSEDKIVCKGFWRNICDLTYNPHDLVCIICEGEAREDEKGATLDEDYRERY